MPDRMAGRAFALAADPSLLAAQLGIDGGYSIEAVPPEGFADFVLHLPAHGFVGANVTIPHKERALALSTPDERAPRGRRGQHAVVRRRRAALDQYRRRRLHRQSRRQRAGLGQRSRTRWCSAPEARRARWCSGCSSAASAACIVANRTLERARALADQFGAQVNPVAWEAIGGLPAARGTAGEHHLARHARPARARNRRRPAAVACRGRRPRLCAAGNAAAGGRTARGLKTADGLGMLLHQAVRGFELWFGQRPEVTSEFAHWSKPISQLDRESRWTDRNIGGWGLALT